MTEGALWWRSAESGFAVFRGRTELTAVLRALLSSQDAPTSWLDDGPSASSELAYILALNRLERRQALRALWQRHGPESLSADVRTGVTPALWQRFLALLGEPPSSGELDADRPRAFRYRAERWSRHSPGAVHQRALWAWGQVQAEQHTPGIPLRDLSPRLLWRSDGRCWQIHPAMAKALDRTARSGAGALHDGRPLPVLTAGPGFFLACAIDAMAEMVSGKEPVSGQELAIFSGTILLPTIGLTRAVGDISEQISAKRGAGDLEDNVQTLFFHLAHPRVQMTVWAIQRVCDGLLIDDQDGLRRLLVALGRAQPPDDDETTLVERVRRALVDTVERALLRPASERTKDGYGFRIVGQALQAALTVQSRPLPMSTLRAMTGVSATGVQVFVARVRAAISDALGAEATLSPAGERARRQLEDLIWLRWTDPEFLA